MYTRDAMDAQPFRRTPAHYEPALANRESSRYILDSAERRLARHSYTSGDRLTFVRRRGRHSADTGRPEKGGIHPGRLYELPVRCVRIKPVHGMRNSAEKPRKVPPYLGWGLPLTLRHSSRA